MIEVRDRSGLQLAIGYQWSFSAAIQNLKRDISAGRYGRPKRLRTRVYWPRDEKYYARSSWAGRQRDQLDGRFSTAPPTTPAPITCTICFTFSAKRRSAATGPAWSRPSFTALTPSKTTIQSPCDAGPNTAPRYSSSPLTPREINAIPSSFTNLKTDRCISAGNMATTSSPNGPTELEINYGSPASAESAEKLFDVLESIRTQQPVVCGPEAAGAQTACIYAAQQSTPTIVDFPRNLVVVEGEVGERQTHVKDLEKILDRCYEKALLPSELGISWAARSAEIAISRRSTPGDAGALNHRRNSSSGQGCAADGPQELTGRAEELGNGASFRIAATLIFVSSCPAQSIPRPSTPVDPPVALTNDGNYFTLSNAYSTALIAMHTGELSSLKYRGMETMGYRLRSPRRLLGTIAPPRRPDRHHRSKTNTGDRAEVSIKGYFNGFTLEERYTMGRHDHGLYTYAISVTPPTPPGGIGESRFGAKLNGQIFNWLSIDAQRNKKMPSGYDWDHGTPLNMKEARRLTTGIYAGQPEHKYDYSACQFKIPAFGWSSTTRHIGLFFINPTIEYLSGGATKYELTGHLDDGGGRRSNPAELLARIPLRRRNVLHQLRRTMAKSRRADDDLPQFRPLQRSHLPGRPGPGREGIPKLAVRMGARRGLSTRFPARRRSRPADRQRSPRAHAHHRNQKPVGRIGVSRLRLRLVRLGRPLRCHSPQLAKRRQALRILGSRQPRRIVQHPQGKARHLRAPRHRRRHSRRIFPRQRHCDARQYARSRLPPMEARPPTAASSGTSASQIAMAPNFSTATTISIGACT